MQDDTTYDVPPEGQSPLPISDEVSGGDTADALEFQQMQRLDHISTVLDELALQTQDDSSVSPDSAVFALDAAQWEEMTGRVQELRDMQSLSLFFSLLLVCGVAALLGGHLWKVFSEGFRR